MVIALLPIKANSERVRGKNFKSLCGRPLFMWILSSLLKSSYIDKVIINTDAPEMLIQCGLPQTDRIIIRNRKKELCGDYVSMNLVLADDIEDMGEGVYLMTHATNPFISTGTINGAIEEFQKNRDSYDSLFSVTEWKTRFYNGDAKPVNHNPDVLIRTQDLPSYYEENSCLYVFTANSFSRKTRG